jgi:hypothetical protein
VTDQPVFVLGGDLQALEPAAFETEEEFQELLARNPRVLDFGSLADGQPLLLLLVAAREQRHARRESGDSCAHHDNHHGSLLTPQLFSQPQRSPIGPWTIPLTSACIAAFENSNGRRPMSLESRTAACSLSSATSTQSFAPPLYELFCHRACVRSTSWGVVATS